MSGPSSLAIIDVGSGPKTCSPDVDTLEAQDVAALRLVTTYETPGHQLTLRAADGTTQ